MQNDELVEDVVKEKLSANDQEIYETCKSLKGENSCETAFKMYECFWKNKSQ